MSFSVVTTVRRNSNNSAPHGHFKLSDYHTVLNAHINVLYDGYESSRDVFNNVVKHVQENVSSTKAETHIYLTVSTSSFDSEQFVFLFIVKKLFFRVFMRY